MSSKGLRPYYKYRLKLEKLKSKTWQLIVIARIILFLELLVHLFW